MSNFFKAISYEVYVSLFEWFLRLVTSRLTVYNHLVVDFGEVEHFSLLEISWLLWSLEMAVSTSNLIITMQC